MLTKKGYLTIALSHSRDGRVLLRRHEGIRDWFNVIKVNMRMIEITVVILLLLFQSKVFECKARQVQHDIASNNLNVEAWLLARKSLAGSNCIHKLNHLLNNSNVPQPRARPEPHPTWRTTRGSTWTRRTTPWRKRRCPGIRSK